MAPGPSSRSPAGPWRAGRRRYGTLVLVDGHRGLRRRSAGGRLLGRRLLRRGRTARRTATGDGLRIHHLPLAGHAPGGGTPPRVALCVRADEDPGRAHGAHLRDAARPGGPDRTGRSRGASQGTASLLRATDTEHCTRENTMRRIAAVAAVTLTILGLPARAVTQEERVRPVAAGGISAPGWQGSVDARAASQGQTIKDTKLANEGNALHVTTGPAANYWNPANTARGDYTVKATFTEPKYMNLNDHPHPYGVFIGGNDLGTDHQSLLYCAAYGNGSFIVRGFAPAPFALNGRHGESNTAVHRAAAPGQPVTQDIALSVKGDKVACLINGAVVATYTRADVVAPGKLKSTDGIYGIRFAHNTEGVVTGLTVTRP